MKGKRIHLVGLLLVVVMIMPLFIVTAAPAIEVLTEEEILGTDVAVRKRLVKAADNAIYLFDASAAMQAKFLDPTMSRYDIARKFMKDRNEVFPDLGYNFGLYLYTPWTPVYPMQPYDRAKFAKALGSLPPEADQGPKELQKALMEVGEILPKLSGRTVVFIFTDGRITDVPGRSPIGLAEDLAEKHDVCFYIISTADDWASERVAVDLAPANFCSRVIPFSAFMNNPNYDTGALYAIKAKDPADNILFKFDKSDIRPEFHGKLDELGTFLQRNPKTYVVLAGYADDVGSQEYNGRLSRRRAESVAAYLEKKFSISKDRIVALWYGKMNPVSDNQTEEGRALNRRVETAVGLRN
jgi:OOP family OmpA-OmpF porin